MRQQITPIRLRRRNQLKQAAKRRYIAVQVRKDGSGQPLYNVVEAVSGRAYDGRPPSPDKESIEQLVDHLNRNR